jgi:biotin-(acetyl-CoA carboxylase) ligase
MVLALAASDAVAALTGVEPGLKWPNDLVWPGDGSAVDRKLAGILAEAEWPPGVGAASGWQAPGPTQRAAVAAGIGLNVAWGDRYPEELRATAVALDEIVGGSTGEAGTVGDVGPGEVPDRVDLLVALLRSLDEGYRLLLSEGGTDGRARSLAVAVGHPRAPRPRRPRGRRRGGHGGRHHRRRPPGAGAGRGRPAGGGGGRRGPPALHLIHLITA